MFLEHPPYINFVPVPVFSLENVKIKMKLVVKYNSLKYAEDEKKSLNPTKKNKYCEYFNHRCSL